MRHVSIKALAAALMLLVLPHTSHATTIFNFSGTLTETDGGSLAPILGAFFGQTFTGSFTVASPLNTVSSSSLTLFELGSSSFTIGNDTWTASNGGLQQQFSGSNEIVFWSTNPLFGNQPTFSGPTVTPFQIPVSSAFFFGFGPDVFTDKDSLAEFSVDDLTIAFFGLQIDDTQLRGVITGLESVEFLSTSIPVPAALPLLLTSLAGLGLIKMRRRRSH